MAKKKKSVGELPMEGIYELVAVDKGGKETVIARGSNRTSLKKHRPDSPNYIRRGDTNPAGKSQIAGDPTQWWHKLQATKKAGAEARSSAASQTGTPVES